VTAIRERDGAARRLGQLHEGVVAVATGHDHAAVLQRIVDITRDLVHARHAAMVVSDPRGVRLLESAAVEPAEGRRSRPGPSLLAADTLGRGDGSGSEAARRPTRTVLEVPVTSRGEVFGTLYLTDPDGDDGFSDAEEELALVLATTGALAIENARLRELAHEVAVDAERQRIGRDLHHTVVQRLFAIGLAMQGTAALTHKPDVAARLETHIDDLDGTIREVRSAIFAIDAAPDLG